MSWMQKLYETYEANVGRLRTSSDKKPLLPVSHTLQQAHVEIVLDKGGSFRRAAVIDPVETVVPATENSASRTSNDAPHGLSDKVQYVAGDYEKFGGRKKPYFESYLSQLERWVEARPHPWPRAVLHYVRKRCVVADLVAADVLHVDAQKRLLTGWEHESKPPEIFRVLTKKEGVQDQGDAFIRWRVETPGEPLSATWEDESLAESWIDFDTSNSQKRGLCFITGVERVLAEKHPAKLRSGKDGAKLISSNDERGYTFRGRFFDANEAAAIGSDVTQKAHSALRWLIGRQGYRNGTLTTVAWAPSGKSIPDPFANSDALLGGDSAESVGENAHTRAADRQETVGDAGQAFARRLAKKIAGYKAELGSAEEIIVLALDSATPGRMAVVFYRALRGSEFLERIESWHSRYAWFQRISKDIAFVGVPAPHDVAAAAFGRRLDDKIARATIERMLPCIVDGRPLPRDLVEAGVRRTNNRVGLENWEWEKTLGIACSLFKGFHEERRYSMALETDRRTRDYLYGRLLAIAERLEARALYLADENRDTTAARLMQRFCDHPYSTWRNIEKGLQPYKSRLQANDRPFLIWITRILDEVHDLFTPTEYTDDTPLSGEYLLAYHCQRRALWERPNGQTPHDPQDDTSAELPTEGDVI